MGAFEGVGLYFRVGGRSISKEEASGAGSVWAAPPPPPPRILRVLGI